ncbi:MAG: hypothetical protein ACK4ON_09255 [Bacteroidia bacterium]
MPTAAAAPATIICGGSISVTGVITAGSGTISIQAGGDVTFGGDINNGLGGFTIGSVSKKRAPIQGATSITLKNIVTTGPATIVHTGALDVSKPFLRGNSIKKLTR